MLRSFYKGKKVLLTGHTGFKGSWLALWLHDMGAEVYGYALEAPQAEDNFNACGLDQLIHSHYGDIRDLKQLKAFFKDVQPDIAFHLAAQALVLPSYESPSETFETNIMGTVHFFEAVRATASVKAAVNITSDKCYQNNEWVWGYRENDAMGGKDPYSASKGCSELVTSAYLNSFFSDTGSAYIASARAGNVIGGGDWARDRIVPDFFRAIKRNEAIVVRRPAAIRPWQHVLEPLHGYLHLGKALYENGSKFQGGWNFGPYESHHSVGNLIETLIQIGGSGTMSVPETVYPHEAQLLKLDISKAVALLPWRPKLDFLKTLQYTHQGYVDQWQQPDLKKARLIQINAFEAED